MCDPPPVSAKPRARKRMDHNGCHELRQTIAQMRLIAANVEKTVASSSLLNDDDDDDDDRRDDGQRVDSQSGDSVAFPLCRRRLFDSRSQTLPKVHISCALRREG